MDHDAILEKVTSVVNETLEVPSGVKLTEGTAFKDLGADSFDLLELVTALEDEFDLTFDDEALEKIATVGDAANAIEAAQ
ncbi:acyl carrier protein [Olsenella sp. Marseille-P4559]|uniref:acyl carrier protein n=1 Tax=Olsenella sp. Marseille-P4559 TaxID=2364795 RepID=UPI001030E9EE|nr:acyl carrier protein [Olsenella sp. Marseille-P4559]